MKTAFVLGGAGARGDFQAGAVRYLYDHNILPNIICGASGGALIGAKLAEGGVPALQGLEAIWAGMKDNKDMYSFEPWVEKLIALGGEFAQIENLFKDASDAQGLGRKADKVREIFQTIATGTSPSDLADAIAQLTHARSATNASPIELKMRGGWTALHGAIAGRPATARDSQGRLNIFVRWSDNSIRYRAQAVPNSPAWSAWTSLGGVATSSPAVGVNADGQLEVFVRGTDNALWHDRQLASGEWSGWGSLGGDLAGEIALTTTDNGRLTAVVRWSDNTVHSIAQYDPSSSNWLAWNDLGGQATSDPVAARNADGHLEVFVRGTDNALWHLFALPGGGLSGWISLGGGISGETAVARNTDGRLEVFVRGTDNALWHNWQNSAGSSTWVGWQSLSGVITGDPEVAQNSDGRLSVFALGAGNAISQIAQDPGSPTGWIDWEVLGGLAQSRPAISINNDGRLEVFIRSPFDTLWHAWQTVASDGWTSQPAAIDRNKIRLSGIQLRISLVSLESSEAQFATEVGELLPPGQVRGAGQPIDLVDALLASGAVPLFFPSVPIRGQHFLDGGIRELVPVQAALDLGADKLVVIHPSPGTTLKKLDEPTLIDIGFRFTDIMLDEIRRGDMSPSGNVSVTHIQASFEVHDGATIDPGLISISMGYGYMRAGDAVTDTPGFNRTRAVELSDAITHLRKLTWEREFEFASLTSSTFFHGYVHDLLEQIRLRKWMVKNLVAARQALPAPTPANAGQWHGAWERYWTPPFRSPANPWGVLTNTAGTTPAQSPATFAPDKWILQEADDLRQYALIKGAVFYLPDPPSVHAIHYDNALYMPELPPHTISAQPLVPMGTTLLREIDSHITWYCDGTWRYKIDDPSILTMPDILARLELPDASYRLVPRGGLPQIPDGGPLFWIGGLVVTDNLRTPLREWMPTPLQVGTNSSPVCHLHNRSANPVTVSLFQVQGDSTSAFSVVTPMPIVVQPNALETIILHFSPTQVGLISATLLIDCNDPIVSRLWVPVRTEALPPPPRGALRVSPEALTFHTVLGEQSELPLRAENIGNADASLISLTIYNDIPREVAQFAAPFVLGSPIAPGQSRDLYIRHIPTVKGTSTGSAELLMQGSSVYTETHTISLLGVTTYREIALNPASLDFGPLQPGTSKTLSFHIRNSGDALLTVSGYVAVLSGREFFLDPSTAFPLTVGPVSSVQLSVTYYAGPTPGRFDSDEFEVASNDPAQPRIRLALRGQISGPHIAVVPDFIDCGRVQQVPVQVNVTIRNDGSSDLTVNAIRLETGQAFSLSGTPSLPAVISGGSQVVFQVKFQPTVSGAYSDHLLVISNDVLRGRVSNSVQGILMP